MKYAIIENEDDFIQALGVCDSLTSAYGIAYNFLTSTIAESNKILDDISISAPYPLENDTGYTIVGTDTKNDIDYQIFILNLQDDEIHLK